MVAAPASCPSRSSSLRIATIWSSIAAATWFGLWCGRRERGARPTSPSVRNRWTRVMTHRRLTPYWRATSLLDRPSVSTAVTIRLGIPIAHPLRQGVNDVPRQV